MPFIAALLLLGCVALTWMILRGRVGRIERPERDPEVDEAIERLREWARRPGVVAGGAAVVALLIVAAMARNPSRWALMLVALGVLAVATGGYVVTERRRRASR